MRNLQIVPVTDSEMIDTVAALADEIWHEHFTPIIGEEQVEYMLDKFQSAPAIAAQLSDGYEYFLFLSDGTPAGYTGVHAEDGQLFLSKLYIRADHRGQHISTQAVEFLKDLCRKRGLSRIWLTCNKYNSHTLDVYRHLGFVTFDTREADIGGGFIMDDYLLELCVV